MWTSPSDLGAKVSRSITQLIKNHPAVGWVPANAVPSEELLALRRKVDELQAKLDHMAAEGPAGAQGLAQGREQFEVHFQIERRIPKQGKKVYWARVDDVHSIVELSWDLIFAWVAPNLVAPFTDQEFAWRLNELIFNMAGGDLERDYPNDKLERALIDGQDFNTIKVQLRALGLIAADDSPHRWILTPYGDQYMNKLLAVKRKKPKRK
jgi:hypothetical protein